MERRHRSCGSTSPIARGPGSFLYCASVHRTRCDSISPRDAKVVITTTAGAAMSERRCGCGCGAALHGRKSQRFVSESHRARAHRAKKAAEGQVTGAAATRVDAGDDAGQPAPSNGSMGRVRGGLEVWLNTPEEVFLNWHYEHCVEPHTARRVFDEFTTANEEAKEIQRQRDEEFQR